METLVHEDVTYEEIHASQDNLWNFLFFTGYLKKVKERMRMDSIYISLAIPNAEVRYIYRSTIMEWFNRQVRQENFSPLYEALLNQDTETVEKVLSEYLMETISFFDYKEDYYHGFVTGMLTKMPGYIVQSNRENGLGRSDIVLRSAPYEGRAIIIDKGCADVCKDGENRPCSAYADRRKENCFQYRSIISCMKIISKRREAVGKPENFYVSAHIKMSGDLSRITRFLTHATRLNTWLP